PFLSSCSISNVTGEAMPVSVCNSSSRKRMRIGRESTQVTTDNTNLWNKDGFSSRLRELINQLQGIQGDVRGVINIPVLDSVAASNHRWSTTYFACRRTSSLHQRKMYGRSAEKKFIIKLISEHKSTGGVTVLPILGIGGIGKTALAQLVYNEPAVENQFDHKIWIWVSNNFDEVRLTREMLDFVSQETHGGLCNLAKLQEILKCNQLLAPFKSDNANNNLILMTTRKPSVAKRRGTAEPIKLGALEKDDFWLLFKAHAFGDENYEEQESLSGIGQKIAQKLKGNPLAAQTAGALLREHLTVEHWTNGLKNEDWKSLHLSSGIMSSLKLCYDELPFPLQQCFSYCSIFPYGYQFPAEELVCMWISHGFVKLDDSSASLKDTGWYYLTDLVNLGFFEQVISSMSNIPCTKMFEEKLRSSFTSVTKLRVNHGHLQYLKLQDSHVELESSPQVSSKFFNRVLDGRLTSLQTIHLENCGECWIVPSLKRPPSLTRLFLRNMQKVREVSFPSLEELVLVEMSELESCVCTSLGDMNSSLRVLDIRNCHALKMFDLLEKHHSFIMKKGSWLPNLRKFIVCDCPHLEVVIPLRPSATFSELLISRVSTSLTMDKFYMETFEIRPNSLLGESFGEMRLDEKILAFHNLRDLKCLEINSCWNLTSISLISFHQLVSLESLTIGHCTKLFSSDVVSAHTHEDMIAADYIALPCLDSLSIFSCGITGKWLSLMLRHAPAVKKLMLNGCPKLTQLRIEEEENGQSNLNPASEASSSGYQNGLSASSDPDGLWCIPSNLTTSLKTINIERCPHLIFDVARFTSLEELQILGGCPKMLSSLVHGRLLLPQSLEQILIYEYPQETIQLCFLNNRTCLKKIQLFYSSALNSLMLHSCTSLEDLTIRECKSLTALHGMESLRTLRALALYSNSSLELLQLKPLTLLEDLDIVHCTSLVPPEGLRSLMNLRHFEVVGSLTGFGESYDGIIFPRLESLTIDILSRLTTPFCKGLTSLQRLELYDLKEARLTDEQEKALLLHRSLQDLHFLNCDDLVHLPVRLHSLPSLKRIKIGWCPRISELPKEGLPPSLEKLVIVYCDDLEDLPAGLHSLPSLKKLKIDCCKGLSRLPKEGLPPSLEQLVIEDCSSKLSKQCRLLATSKLKVKIDEPFLG
ncbi:putative disease resistance protein RGA3, partial [Triticum aestivum]|uniref:putative disease resistance protein RGA3 n=1 Tax=Triticum aestivum TaxID=4565 RepID=UPI001D0202BD